MVKITQPRNATQGSLKFPLINLQNIMYLRNLDVILSSQYTRIKRGRARRGDYRRRRRRRRRKGDSSTQKRRIVRRDVSGMRKLINETVCGTDRKTYKNECEMRIEACHKKEMITVSK